MKPSADSKEPLENEEAIVRRAIERDATSFGFLYEFYLDRIFRYVNYRVGTTGEAEDLTEMVFLKAWEAIDRFEPRGAPFAAWLYRLAHNLVVDHYRGRRPTTPLEAMGEAERLDDDVETIVQESLDAEAVREAVRRLRPEYQHLIALRFVEGLSHLEVARIIGKSEGATRVIQHRALQALARAIQVAGSPDRGPRTGSPGPLPG
ncbi:MAG: sigma-70 family RNA polymerase sigma factor [Chloroflexota bacterium]